MGTRIELFCKFTRKTEIGLEEGFIGWWWTLLRSGPRRGRGRSFEGLPRRGKNAEVSIPCESTIGPTSLLAPTRSGVELRRASI